MKKLFFLFAALCFTILAQAQALTSDAIYVENDGVKKCYRFTDTPTIQYEQKNVEVFIEGKSVLSLPLSSHVKVTYGTYQDDTAIEQIFVTDPAKNGNADGKYLYQGRFIIVKDNQYYDIQGKKIKKSK